MLFKRKIDLFFYLKIYYYIYKMSWIFNTLFGWVNKVDDYRNNWCKDKRMGTEPSNKKEFHVRFSNTDAEAVDFATETDIMIADLVPPQSMMNSRDTIIDKYYVSWHSVDSETDKTPGVPGINMFNDFKEALEEFEKMVDAPFGKTFIIILWASNNEILQKLQLGGVKNYSDYKNSINTINNWVKNNIYSAKLFGETIEDL